MLELISDIVSCIFDDLYRIFTISADGDKAATGAGSQVGVSTTTKSAPPTRAFLEKRVQQLEGSLENKDKECSRKLRALQQKHTALEVQNVKLM